MSIFYFTEQGMVQRVPLADVPTSHRGGKGYIGCSKLHKDDKVVAAIPICERVDKIAITTAKGVTIIFHVSEVHNNDAVRAIRLEKTDSVVSVFILYSTTFEIEDMAPEPKTQNRKLKTVNRKQKTVNRKQKTHN